MKQERKQPFVWPSWISKLIAGEDHCFWKVWFKSHFTKFDKMPSDFNTASWVIKHTAMIRQRTEALERLGYRVMIEDQNSFSWDYKGAQVNGKPDIVAFGQEENFKGEMENESVIEDIKSGKCKTSDQVQVWLYQIILPKAMPEYESVRFKGTVVYKPGVKDVPIPETIVDDASLKTEVINTIDKVIGPEMDARCTPSRGECRFWDITSADCAQRIKL